MAGLTSDRNTVYSSGEYILVPLAAGAEIFQGSIVVSDTNGYVFPVRLGFADRVFGIAQSYAKNNGANGDVSVYVRRRCCAWLDNDVVFPVRQRECFKTASVWAIDDHTVTRSPNGPQAPIIGRALQVDPVNGVLCEIGLIM